MSRWWKRLLESGVEVVKVSAIVAVPAALLFAHVWNQYRITKLGYEISDETQRRENLEDENRKLRIEATVESRSEGLSTAARERFGLEPVEPEQILTVELDSEETDEQNSEALDETEHAKLEERGSGRR